MVNSAPVLMLLSTLLVASAAAPATTFTYVQSRPVDVRDEGHEFRVGDATIRDITYASPMHGRVPAYFVYPAHGAVVAALEYGHWSLGDRNEFLPEAIEMAQYGIASLLPDAPFVRPAPWTSAQLGNFTNPSSDRAVYVQTVVDLRRGLDVIAQRFPKARNRIGFVGHSYDGGIGGNLAGSDRRYRAFVLMAGSGAVLETSPSMVEGAFSEEQTLTALRALPRGAVHRYLEMMAPLDPDRWISSATSPIFMQFAKNDMFVSHRQAKQYARAADELVLERWYIGGHELNDPHAREDRIAWLLSVLKVKAR